MENQGANSLPRSFSLSAIPGFVSKLTDVQKALFEQMWASYVSLGSPFPIRSLPPIIGRQTVKEALEGVNGSLIYETKESNGNYFKLTFYGALLTSNGPVLAAHLVHLLEFVQKFCDENTTERQIHKAQIQIGLDLSDADILILFRLLTLGLPPDLPIYLSGHQLDGKDWQLTIRDEAVIDFLLADDVKAFLNQRLAEDYKPDVPCLYDERTRFDFSQSGSSQRTVEGEAIRYTPQSLTGEETTDSSSNTSLFFSTPQQLSYTFREPPLSSEISKQPVNSEKPTRSTKNKKPKQKPKSSSPATATSALSATRTEAEAVSDFLGREKLTQALHRLLTEREDEHPFAIGLFGHWGAGKSSQVNFLQEELKKTGKPNILVAEFNAWKNEKATNIAAMLAQAVVDGLVADMNIFKKLWLAIRLEVLRHSNAKWHSMAFWMSWVWVILPFVILFSLLGVLLWFAPFHDEIFAPVIKLATGAVVAIASLYHFTSSHLTAWFKRLDMKKSLSLLSMPDYSAHRGLIMEIHRTLRNLCSLCLVRNSPKEGKYLLLVVDDLDRCGVDTVKEVLDAVRLVADIPRVVALVAIDERMAFAAVEKHYQQFGDAGRSPALVARDYLAKVLQVSVTLPEVNHDGIGSFVDKKIFVDTNLAEAEHGVGEVGKIVNIPPDNNIGESLANSQRNIAQNPKPAEAEVPTVRAKHSAESPKTDTKNIPPLQQSSLPEEREMFKELAKAYNFSNPRLLWRLYMAWRLLKSLTLGASYTLKEVEIPMNLLFWREWMHQLQQDQRKVFSDWVGDVSALRKPPDMPEAIYSAVKWTLRTDGNIYEPIVKVVDAVLLPFSPSKVSPAPT